MSKSWAGQGVKGEAGSGGFLGKVIPNPKLRLLDQVREVMRIKHYGFRTERCCCDWIRRYILFHRRKTESARKYARPSGLVEKTGSDAPANLAGIAEARKALQSIH